MSNCAIILAGGEGKRMKSDKPKTLSPVLGKPMLLWVISALKNAGIDDICVVKGFKKECVEEFLGTLDFPVQSVFQAPFMTGDTIRKSLAQHTETGCAATVISAKVDDPTGYGRIVRDDNGGLKAIVEHKDADDATRAIDEVNSGGYWFDCALLLSVLGRIKSDNKAGEYYLPDAVALLLSDGKSVGAYTAECSDAVLGANDPAQLEELNQIAREKGYSC